MLGAPCAQARLGIYVRCATRQGTVGRRQMVLYALYAAAACQTTIQLQKLGIPEPSLSVHSDSAVTCNKQRQDVALHLLPCVLVD